MTYEEYRRHEKHQIFRSGNELNDILTYFCQGIENPVETYVPKSRFTNPHKICESIAVNMNKLSTYLLSKLHFSPLHACFLEMTSRPLQLISSH